MQFLPVVIKINALLFGHGYIEYLVVCLCGIARCLYDDVIFVDKCHSWSWTNQSI